MDYSIYMANCFAGVEIQYVKVSLICVSSLLLLNIFLQGTSIVILFSKLWRTPKRDEIIGSF
jgi:hypothetical protein